MSDVLENFNRIVDYNYQALDTIKREYGTIKELVPDTDSAKVVVKFLNRNEDNGIETILTLLNKTGERLQVEDNVMIYYWNTLSDGYVAIKLGESSPPVDRPDKTSTFSYVMTDDLDTIRNIADDVHYLGLNPEFVPVGE